MLHVRMFTDRSSLTSGQIAQRQQIADRTAAHLSEWGEDGLRTLCFAYKPVDQDYFTVRPWLPLAWLDVPD